MKLDFLTKPRNVTSGFHYLQAKKWLEWDEGHALDNTIVYACLELRIALERFWFEVILLLKGAELTNDERRRCRTTQGLQALLKETEPALVKRIKFHNKLASYEPGIPSYPMVDVKYLIRTRGRLSEYCHMQQEPKETWELPNFEFQSRAIALANEVVAKLRDWLGDGTRGLTDVTEMPDEVTRLWKDYLQGEISLEQVGERYHIMMPVLNWRMMRNRK